MWKLTVENEYGVDINEFESYETAASAMVEALTNPDHSGDPLTRIELEKVSA